jgi:superfamily II DNA or RNA helicase
MTTQHAVNPRHEDTRPLRDRLSRLTFRQACKLLGPEGARLIRAGGRHEIVIEEQVFQQGDLFQLRLPGATVSITLMATARDRIHWNCTACTEPCEHVGAAFSLALEEKTALGLAAPPKERTPVESMSEEELVATALAERAERAKTEKFRLMSSNPSIPWTDYTITSVLSGKTYRVALRSVERGLSYCSCPDFRTNTLGTCKHVLYALRAVKKKFTPAQVRRKPVRRGFSLRLHYGETCALRLETPTRMDDDAEAMARPLVGRDIDDIDGLLQRIKRLERAGWPVRVYPDAAEFIDHRLFRRRMERLVAEIRRDPANHPLRTELLKTELLPYQLDGIAFAAGVGRAVLADDMGLGKTIQGIGVAELLARQAGISRVLVICPTSLKSQWRNEVERFSHRSCQLVIGGAKERPAQYDNGTFFTICNYEQVLRDLLAVETVPWDLIVLDEGQRIKNWEGQTTRVIKSLKSRFALVLSGTPLENRLDELFSVVQFVDDRRLGPGFRFFNRHRVVDEKGKVLGFKNLGELRASLAPVLLRRTRDQVLDQLPPRTTEIVRIAPTQEQLDIHTAQMRIVASIVRKPFISEMDLLRLRQALLMCRMVADGTALVDKQEPGWSTKLERLEELFEEIFDDAGCKVVLFSEWTSMLDRIEQILKRQKRHYVRLDGSVRQQKRQELVHTFQHDPRCRLFITTNAGSTGLNLQAANTVINVDLPWNPAVLEQRIARAHRMGQKKPVQVYVLVTEQTIEEQLLTTLDNKQNLALAALDPESEVDTVDMVSGMDELRRRLEVLTGRPAPAPVDRTQLADVTAEVERRDRLAAAGGEMLTAVFGFLGELVNQGSPAAPPEVVEQVQGHLAACVAPQPDGSRQLTFTLPNAEALEQFAGTLARLIVVGRPSAPADGLSGGAG